MQIINPLLDHLSLIAYFRGANNYTWIHFRNGNRQLLAKPLAYFEKKLPAFIRIHKTALINLDFVDSIHPQPRAKAKMAGLLRLQDGTELPVSRRRWNAVVEQLKAMSIEVAPLGQPSPADQRDDTIDHTCLIQAVLTGATLLLTRHCLNQLARPCILQTVKAGAELTETLLLTPQQKWPALIIIDARTHPTNCMLTLQNLKSHDRLRAIPVIWLAAPDTDGGQAYLSDANSVVIVSEDPSILTRILQQLLHYWLIIVQLPF